MSLKRNCEEGQQFYGRVGLNVVENYMFLNFLGCTNNRAVCPNSTWRFDLFGAVMNRPCHDTRKVLVRRSLMLVCKREVRMVCYII